MGFKELGQYHDGSECCEKGCCYSNAGNTVEKQHLSALNVFETCFVLESPGISLIQNRKNEHLSA